MISICTTIILIILFFISGKIFESLKRLLMLIVDIILKILNLCGIQVSRRETKLHTSRQFRNTFKDIKIVKKSKQNEKLKPSINLIALIGLLFSITMIAINFTCDGIISKFLYDHNPLPSLIQTHSNMEIIFIAVSFSIISFSISKLVNQWKETAEYRKTKKQMKTQQKVLSRMSSKDLLDAAKQKDKEGYFKLISQENAREE